VTTPRRAVLDALKRHGPLGAKALADELSVTPVAVRRQLARLEEDGLVTHDEEATDGRGRPAHRYRLTPAAEGLFPKRYGDLTTELLGYLEGPRGRRRVAGAEARLAGRPLAEQVAELATILDEDGYLADCEPLADGGGWRITEHNCAILTVAQRYGQACVAELDFIRAALPGASVERQAHMMKGAHVCSYVVRPLASQDSGPAPSGAPPVTAARAARAAGKPA
jgi:predicted ArsR family transcriptional regulator